MSKTTDYRATVFTDEYNIEANDAEYTLKLIKECLEIHNKGQKDDNQNPVYLKDIKFVNQELRNLLWLMEYKVSGFRRFVE
jgi:hypothetical protein